MALAEDLGLVEEGASDEEIDAAIDEIDYDDPAVGEALFNQDAAGGAFACARCHTRGWSIILEGDDAVSPPDADLSSYVGFPPGSGAFGPNLTGGLIPRQFATYEQLVDVHHHRQRRRRAVRPQRHRQRPDAQLR